jgi:hypothetical protein
MNPHRSPRFRTAPLACALSAVLFCAFGRSPARADDSPRHDAPSTPAPAAAKPIDLENTKCPVTGAPVKPGVTDVVNGFVVHFCCPHCPAKYRANPAQFEAALRSEPAVAQRLNEAKGASAMGSVASSSDTMVVSKGAAFHDAMRKLWEEHVLWTRLLIISATADLPDADATTKRLLRNQDDIGNAWKSLYGDDAGSKLTALLKDHITTAAELVAASKAGDSAKADAAKTKWYANADDIATFMSAANPTAWPLAAAKSMMREHLDTTTAEVVARLGKDWDADIAAYDRVREQALKMADMLSDGIRMQFPKTFQ